MPSTGIHSCSSMREPTDHILSYHKYNISSSSIVTSSETAPETITPDRGESFKSQKSDKSHSDIDTATRISNCALSIISKLRSFRAKKNALLSRGYKKTKIICPTIQGQVFIAEKTKSHKESLLIYGYIRKLTSNKTNLLMILSNICFDYMTSNDVAIKTAEKILYEPSNLNEDITKESNLMSMFMCNNPPVSLIKYYDFFEDENNYYLVMERGGIGLFEFVVQCHEYINQGILSLTEWKKTVRFIFAEMITVIDWMHNTVHCCNLDISLENIVMSKNTFVDLKSGEIKNLGIRFIDFGLTQHFDKINNSRFICNKFVGKLGYQSPQIFNKLEPFCANKSDIWSLGICLFMISIGAPPYNKPCSSDPAFEVLMNNKMISLLKSWGRLKYIDNAQYDLLMKMLRFEENERISIEDIMEHEWIRSYFTNTKIIENDSCIDHQIKNTVCISSIKESETFEVEIDDICAIANMDDQ